MRIIRRAQWNTGNRYSKEGQRIVAVLTDAGEIHYNDLDRMIDGVICDRECLYGADPGPPSVFGLDTSENMIKVLVNSRYTNGYRHFSRSDIGRNLTWE